MVMVTVRIRVPLQVQELLDSTAVKVSMMVSLGFDYKCRQG